MLSPVIPVFGWRSAIPPSRPAIHHAGVRGGGQGPSRGTRPEGRDGRALRDLSPPASCKQTDAATSLLVQSITQVSRA